MNDSEDRLESNLDAGALPDDSPYALDLPVAPDWFSDAPEGTPDDGWRMMLEAAASLEDPDATFRRREQHRVRTEFRF